MSSLEIPLKDGAFDAILDSINQGLVIYDRDLVVVRINRRAREILHVTEEMFALGEPFEKLAWLNASRGGYGAASSVADRVARRMERVRTFEPIREDQQIFDGSTVEVFGRPIADGCYVITYTDVTRRTRAEAGLLKARDALQQEVERQTNELSSNEERFRDFAETGADWLWETDEKLRFTYMSPNVERIMNVPPEWHYGKTREELLGEDYDRSVWSAHFEDLNARRPFRDFTYLRVGEGIVPKWLSVNGKPVFDGDGKFRGYRGTGRDITALMQREVALQASEKNLREILERSPIGVAVLTDRSIGDLAKAERLFINDALLEMFGATSNAELGAQDMIESWVDPEQLNIANSVMKSGRDLINFEAHRRRLDGTEWWVSLNTRPILFEDQPCVMVWNFDITDRKRAEAALQDSEAQYRLVTDSLPVNIMYVDKEFRYRFINETGIRWYGKPRSEIIGRTVEQIYGADHTRFAPHIAKVFDGQTFSVEDTITYGDGVTRAIQIAYIPHFAAGETVVGYFALVEDVTGKKQTEAALRQAQKMEAVGQLTGGVAHDFNNLLGIIIGNLDFLAEDLEGDTENLALIEAAIEAAENGAELNRQLLAFSRKQALQSEIVDINSLIAAVADMLKRSLGETISVQFTKSDDLSLVDVDPRQLQSAIFNLAVNARHAMQDGGQLMIESKNVRLDEAYAERLDDIGGGEYVMLAVTDTGAGMTADVMEHVFEPFFTTKGVGQGSGLGLSMVFGFVKQSHGHISIDSVVGEGTTVKLYFPVSRAEETEDTIKAQEAIPLGKGETVLIVEDDDGLRDVAEKTISGLGYQTITVPDGPAALELLGGGTDIDVLFTDIVLPRGMNGVELGKAAKEKRPALKILYASGYTGNAVVNNGVVGSEIELLDKPYRRGDLANLLRQVLHS